MNIVAQDSVNSIRVNVYSANEKVGESFAIVVAVIVENQIWGLSEGVCFGSDFVAGVDSVPERWDLVAEKY